MDQLAEDDTVPEEEGEIVRSSRGGQGWVSCWDHFELIQPGDTLLPERVHGGH